VLCTPRSTRSPLHPGSVWGSNSGHVLVGWLVGLSRSVSYIMYVTSLHGFSFRNLCFRFQGPANASPSQVPAGTMLDVMVTELPVLPLSLPSSAPGTPSSSSSPTSSPHSPTSCSPTSSPHSPAASSSSMSVRSSNTPSDSSPQAPSNGKVWLQQAVRVRIEGTLADRSSSGAQAAVLRGTQDGFATRKDVVVRVSCCDPGMMMVFADMQQVCTGGCSQCGPSVGVRMQWVAVNCPVGPVLFRILLLSLIGVEVCPCPLLHSGSAKSVLCGCCKVPACPTCPAWKCVAS
jgi:hypothetical protein